MWRDLKVWILDACQPMTMFPTWSSLLNFTIVKWESTNKATMLDTVLTRSNDNWTPSIEQQLHIYNCESNTLPCSTYPLHIHQKSSQQSKKLKKIRKEMYTSSLQQWSSHKHKLTKTWSSSSVSVSLWEFGRYGASPLDPLKWPLNFFSSKNEKKIIKR